MRRIHRERRNLGIRARFIEERDGIALDYRSQNPMLRCANAPSGPLLKYPTEIDNERPLKGCHINPITVQRPSL